METNFFITKDIINHKKGKEILEKIKNYKTVESEEEFLKILKDKKLTFEEEKNYFLFTVKKGKFLKSYYLDWLTHKGLTQKNDSLSTLESKENLVNISVNRNFLNHL